MQLDKFSFLLILFTNNGSLAVTRPQWRQGQMGLPDQPGWGRAEWGRAEWRRAIGGTHPDTIVGEVAPVFLGSQTHKQWTEAEEVRKDTGLLVGNCWDT